MGCSVLEEPEDSTSDRGSECESDPEMQLSENLASGDELEEEDIIPNPSLCGLGFETMLRSVLPSENSIKNVGSIETELKYTARPDARCLGEDNIPGLGSAAATIRVKLSSGSVWGRCIQTQSTTIMLQDPNEAG